jgi:hypothetical protein
VYQKSASIMDATLFAALALAYTRHDGFPVLELAGGITSREQYGFGLTIRGLTFEQAPFRVLCFKAAWEQFI